MKTAILDSSFMIGVSFVNDAHLAQSIKIYEQLVQKEVLLVTNQFLVAETATVLLQKTKDTALVADYLDTFSTNTLVKMDPFAESDIEATHTLMRYQQKYKKGFLSWFDCSLIVSARKYEDVSIVSFDQGLLQYQDEFNVLGVA